MSRVFYGARLGASSAIWKIFGFHQVALHDARMLVLLALLLLRPGLDIADGTRQPGQHPLFADQLGGDVDGG